MNLRITFKFTIAFLALTFLMLELHEIVHTSVGRLICGAWGARDFNAWNLCDGCEKKHSFSWLSTLAGPTFTFVMIWIGAYFMKPTNSNRQKSLGFALLFANTPFARILNPILKCGDEQNLVYMIFPDIAISSTITLILIVLITAYPLYLAFKTIPSNKIGYFLLFFLLPTIIIILTVLVLLNTLLSYGIGSDNGILGSPILVNIWTGFVGLVLLLMRKQLETIFQ